MISLPPTFTQFIRALQEHEPLTVDELWNIAAFLQLVLLESILNAAHALLRAARVRQTRRCSPRAYRAYFPSIRTDWSFLIEPLIAFDVELRQDPEGIYEKMDFESRQLYRKRVAFIARQSDCTETEVAQAALDLARDGSSTRHG